MVDQVSFENTTFNELPYKFEAGTPNVSGVLGLESAIQYLQDLDLKSVHAYENELLDYMTLELLKIDNYPAVVYSRLSLFCPVDGHLCPECIGLAREDAARVLADAVVYCLTR